MPGTVVRLTGLKVYRSKAIEIHFTDESRRLATELFRAERRAGMCRIMENAGDD